ncbi:uncharacterized protein C7orf57 homolog [Mastacembelus armatus]|uniref:Uncharacterized protein n=1 Tax=Mastacembelus armatus TaxID=205130 RepID=A0A3Q3RKQ9_9TELE|nr:uncharacterized protein C7orf57 homolog [Mastacembelus armatus]
MCSEKSSVLMSNDLHPTKSGVKTGYHTINGHISQIPGLSPTTSTLPEDRARGRRVGVLENDSDYVKLAKQGGHKGLLWHDETIIYKPNSYKPPEWFCPASEENDSPSEEKKSPGAFQPLEPPFGTDSMSAWERDDGSSSGNRKSNDVHCSQMEKFQSPNQYYESSKYKRIVFDKKAAPVNMSKLLSFGYADDNKPIVNNDV